MYYINRPPGWALIQHDADDGGDDDDADDANDGYDVDEADAGDDVDDAGDGDGDDVIHVWSYHQLDHHHRNPKNNERSAPDFACTASESKVKRATKLLFSRCHIGTILAVWRNIYLEKEIF